ncbi:cell division protein FtsQ/DivIB [Neorickettsia findlayensis]|uniref:FtsQ-type POTRA domain-containing protein n=1 Tax=Neorickettsia findlayensis TaxID=2686014 RepID=A0A6P1GAA6_9RICK|nr:FtsQ-type POTRA domain-containing protein [Neorickettsia findlayensis]QHD65285.1 FtsQ-type POTRA domain-containing protein [Neorickettsia findlayensis]
MSKRIRKSFILLSCLLFSLIVIFGGINLTYRLKYFFDTLLIENGYTVSKVETRGCNYVDKQQIFSFVEPYEGRNILSVPLTEIRSKVLQEKWTAKAYVIRKLPNTIIIIVEEYKPLALLNDESVLADDLVTVIPLKTPQERERFRNLLKIDAKSLNKGTKPLSELRKKM